MNPSNLSRYTPFPSLHSHRMGEDRCSDLRVTRALPVSKPRLGELVVAWAAVLLAYSGAGEEVVISVDNKAVKVSPSQGTVSPIQGDQPNLDSVDKTGVFTELGDPVGFCLYVRLASDGDGCLVSQSELVPVEHLSPIAAELAERIQWARHYPEKGFAFRRESGLRPSELNIKPEVLAGPVLLHHLFEIHAYRDDTALEYRDVTGKRRCYSFREVNSLSECFASQLQVRLARWDRSKTKKQHVVPLLIPQSPALYVAILAILKAGAAFCPLDLEAPVERLRFILADLSAGVAIADELFAANLVWDNGPEVVRVPAAMSTPNGTRGQVGSNTPALDGSDLAYVMYTSGSTGTPKGVGVAHSSITQSLHAHERHIPEFTRFLQFAAPTFDVFVFEMFFPLSRGKTLVSSDRQSLLNDLPSTINALSVDGAVMTPTVVGALLQKRENVPGLRVLMTIGEMLTRTVVDKFGESQERPGILYAMYGPTEAAVHCTMASKLQAESKVGIIGQPLDTVAAYIIAPHSGATSPDHSLDILPVGHVGELVVGGHQLAVGYLNRPEQTATAFVTADRLGRVYRTGDKARLLPNGMLECLGRLIDDQVKLRGHRLELGEIERVAADTPGIRHAIAAIIDGILVVFCLPGQDGISTAAVYQTCRRWLPSPIVPEDIRIIQEIPRVASGKVDKRALEAGYRRHLRNIDDRPRDSESDTATEAKEEPWTHDERTIRAVLARLAGLEESSIGRHTTIFRMGLDSIRAVRIAADLRELGLTVNAIDVLQHTSISGLAEFVSRSSNGTKRTLPDFDFKKFDADYRPTLSSALGIQDSKWRSVRPCTPVQAAMIAGFISSEGKMYLSHILMELQDGVSLDDLERAWNAVAAKYAVLRTGFARTRHPHHPFAMLEYHMRDRLLAWQNIECRLSVTEEIDHQRESIRRRFLQSLVDPPWQICVFRDNKKVFVQLSALHSLFDAQSLHMILSDVATALAGQVLSQEVPIEPVLGAILTSSVADADTHRDFWQRLGSNMQSTMVPSLSPFRSTGGKCLTRSLQSSWTGKELEERSASQGVTVAAVGQAAWARLLAAYAGQTSVTFGVVFSARTVMEETVQLAFPCVTTLPIGYHVQSSNRELLLQIMKRNSDVAMHQHIPLRKVQEWIRPDRGTVFNTIFAFQKGPKETKGVLPWQTAEEVLRVDYAISVESEITGDDRVILSLTFEEDILPLPQAELLLRQLEDILTDTISNPDGPSSDFAQMTPGLLSIERAKDQLIPSKVNLAHEFVEHLAAVSPRKVALQYCQDLDNPSTTKAEWTYSELNAAGNHVRDIVLRQGLNVGDLVAICFEKCPEASFAIIGILKAGCGYVALDPDAPIARKKFILEDSGAKLVLIADRYFKIFAETIELPTVPIRRGSVPADSSTVQLRPAQPVRSDSICYCLYTSGTTGTPKGCEITHENVVQAILAFQRIFAGRWNPESRWLQFASYHFDVSVLEQFWSWSVGISVVSVPRDLMLSDLPGTIQKLGITHIDLTPSLARTLHPSEAPGLYGGVFITGGELLKQEIIDAWGQHGCIHNGYGPTESTIGNTMKARVGRDGKPSNIGPQFDNVGTYVLTPGTNIPIPRGAVGELCVSGPLVGRGYRNRSDLTKQRFPHLEKYGERVYRTGDLVRLLHNGDFDYVGRTDHQVKLRGQRLELAEVDEVIKKGVLEVSEVASLVLRHHMVQSEQLVCFVVLKQRRRLQSAPSVEWSSQNASCIRSIRDVCRAKLPGYGVPSHIILVNYLPLSFTNKLDLNRLKDMYQDATLSDLQRLSDLARSPNVAWSEAEEKVVSVLGEFFGRDKKEINRDTNLFELGLDSITVIELANMLRKRGFSQAKPSTVLQNAVTDGLVKALLGKKLPPASMTNSSFKRQQELYAFSHKHAYGVTRALGVPYDSVEAILPCTPLQEGMLTVTMTRNNALYFNAFYFDLNANVSLTQLQAAWNAVVCNCPVLRLCFCATSDGSTQVFRKAAEPNIVKLTLSSEEMLPTVRQNRLEKWREQDVASFKEPLQVLFLQAPLKTVMVVHMFHALYDGISLDLMLQRLNEEYHNAKDLDYGPSFLKVLPLGPLLTLHGAREFWLHHLNGAQPSRVPSMATEQAPEQFEMLLELDCIERLEDVKRRLNVTYQAFFQASWTLALREHFQRNVTLGMVVSGRAIDVEGAELTIGPMFNTIPFYLSPDSCDMGASVITACHDFNIASLPYQHTPLRDIMKWCRISKDQPLFDILFVFDRDMDDTLAERPKLFCLTESVSPAEYPLAVEVRLRRDRPATVTMVAQDSMVDRETAASLLKEFSRNLEHLISDPHFEPRALSSGQTRVEEDMPRKGKEGRQATLPRTESKQNFSWSREALLLREELSNLASVSSNDINSGTSIFDLGLDSIDAIKLSSRLRMHGVMLTVGVIMEELTISRMLEKISNEAESGSKASSELSVETVRASLRMHLATKPDYTSNVEDVLPTTGLQEAMVAKMLSSDGSYYFNHEVLKLLPGVDLSKLMDAWDEVIRSTPILRTSFAEVDDPDIHCGYAQLVHRPAMLTWDSITVPTEESFEDAIAQVNPQHSYNNRSGPPLRLSVLHHCSDLYLLFSIAHALYDGWSLNLLHEDVHRAYHDTYIPRPSYIPAIELMLQASTQAARDFWSSQLSGVSGTLVTQQPQNPGEAAGVQHFRELQSKVPTSSMLQFLRAHGVTLQALGHVCWSFALAHYVGTLEVVFGAVLAGRDFEDAHQIQFPTMNTVPVRSIIHGTCKDMLVYMTETNTRLAPFQHCPLRTIQACAGYDGKELFNTIFIVQRRPESTTTDDDRLYVPVLGESGTEYPICVEMEVVDDSVLWRGASHDAILDLQGLQDLLNRLDSVLVAILTSPDSPAVESTDDGTTICGLSPFQERNHVVANESNSHQPQVKAEASLDEWSAREQSIRKVLSLVTKVSESEIRKDQTAYHLGLDSISAIKVSSILKKRSISLSVREILQAPSIGDMAVIAGARSKVDAAIDIDCQHLLEEQMKGLDLDHIMLSAGIQPAEVELVLPASPGQVYLLSIWQQNQGTVFHSTFQYRADAHLNSTRLETAWAALLEQCPILRTTFAATESRDTPVLQLVLRKGHNPIRWGYGEIKGYQEIEDTAVSTPSVRLFTHQESDGTLLEIQLLHAYYDAVSLPLIVSNLQRLYNDPEATTESQPRFDEFLARTVLSSDIIDRKAFWQSYLGPAFHARTRRSEEPRQGDNFRRAEIFRPVSLPATQLEGLTRTTGLTFQSLFLAAFASSLSSLRSRSGRTPEAAVIFGVYLANRSHRNLDLSKLAAPTINFLPLKVNIHEEEEEEEEEEARPGQNLKAMAEEIQQDLRTISSPQNAAVSLWEIDDWTGIRLDSFVNLIKLPAEDDELGDGDGNDGSENCQKQESEGTRKAILHPVESKAKRVRREVVVLERGGFVEPQALRKNPVKNSYLPSLDIEAKLRPSDDVLDIGVFAPTDKVSLDDADSIIEGIEMAFRGLLT